MLRRSHSKGTTTLLLLLATVVLATLHHFTRCEQQADPAPQRIKSALMIVDVQNCFVEGGTLAVDGGRKIVDVINDIRKQYDDATTLSLFDMVIRTQDWHCPHHASFASMYKDKVAFDKLTLTYNKTGSLCTHPLLKPTDTHLPDYGPYGIDCSSLSTADTRTIDQVLWPNHCVQHTDDAKFVSELTVKDTDHVQQKGMRCDVDAYSAFYDNGHFEEYSQLAKIMKDKGIQRVFMTGIALDYCVYYSAADAAQFTDMKTYVVLDATVGIGQETIDAAMKDMKNKGVKFIRSHQILDVVNHASSMGNVVAWKNVLLMVGALVFALVSYL